MLPRQYRSILLAAIVILLLIGIAACLRGNNSAEPAPLDQKDVTKSFEDVVNEKNFTGLTAFLAESVNFTIEATSCCGTVPRDTVAERLTYIRSAEVFNFSQDQELVRKIKAARPSFANDTIGIARNDYVFIYGRDAQNKINKIRLAATYKLFVSD